MGPCFSWDGFVFLLFGFSLLASASMGLLARTAGADFSKSYSGRLFTALSAVSAFIFLLFKPGYKYCEDLLSRCLSSAVLASLVFARNRLQPRRAKRWIVGPFLSAVGFLKLGIIVYVAAWISSKRNIADFKTGFLPFAGILAATGVIGFTKGYRHLGSDNNKLRGFIFLGGGKIKHLLIGLAIIGLLLPLWFILSRIE